MAGWTQPEIEALRSAGRDAEDLLPIIEVWELIAITFYYTYDLEECRPTAHSCLGGLHPSLTVIFRSGLHGISEVLCTRPQLGFPYAQSGG